MRAQIQRWLDRARGWLGRPLPGIAHHRARGLAALWSGHARAFHRHTVVDGQSASSYFRAAGIAALAEQHGGLCSFRMGRDLALYQAVNTPLVCDQALAPSLDTNRALFGDFVGALPESAPTRPGKRRAIEASLGSARFVAALEPALRAAARAHLAGAGPSARPLDDFALDLVAHVDSVVPGVLDLTQRPLTHYLASSDYGKVARSYFDLASDVISNVNPAALHDTDALVPFIRAVLDDNHDAIAAAPPSNLILRHFALWDRPFTRGQIAALSADEIKELGTVIVATYDTTHLSLLWAIAYVEADPALKCALSRGAPAAGGLALSELVALEAVRLGGSNPTALWRRVIAPFELDHRGARIRVPAGTVLWLDRRLANQDPAVFPAPCRFSPDNVRAIARDRDTVASLLSRGRYEINSFAMVNTERNPRKCPGRVFSVRQQAVLLEELYGGFDVATQGIDLALRPHSAMPRPRAPGTIRLTPRRAAGAPS